MRHILLLSVLILAGCLTTVQYVCPDGSLTVDPRQCTSPTTAAITKPLNHTGLCREFKNSEGEPDQMLIRRCELRESPQTEYCLQIPVDEQGFGQTQCLTELAALQNNTQPCSRLSGNLKILCEAAAKKDARLCAMIPVPNLQQECNATIQRYSKKTGQKQNCSGAGGLDPIWCLAEGADTPQDCLQIDETKHKDEALLCRARVGRDEKICRQIGENIMRNVCLVEVLGL